VTLSRRTKPLYRIAEELRHARRNQEIVTLEQEQLMGEESEIDDEMARYHELIREQEEEIQGVQQQVAARSQEITTLSDRFEKENQHVVDLRLQQTSWPPVSKAAYNTLRRLEDFSRDGARRLEQLAAGYRPQKRTPAADGSRYRGTALTRLARDV
jgi:chromosome segregation protein